jgi:hypothetical protein
MQQSFSSTGSSASFDETRGCIWGGDGGAASSRELSSSRSASKRAGPAAEGKEACFGCSESPPDGELPSAAFGADTGAVFGADAGAAEARRALPARGSGLLVLIIAGDETAGKGSLVA